MSTSSLWSVVSKMPPERFNNSYLGFLQHVRPLLADWLENQPWEFLDCSDSFYLNMAQNLFTGMVDELRKATQRSGNKADLQQVNCLGEICKSEPLRMVETFRRILETEKAAVIKQFRHLPISYCLKQEDLKFGLAAKSLLHKLGEAKELHDRLKLAASGKAPEHLKTDVASVKVKLTSLILEAATVLEKTQLQVLKRIHIWKRQQQLAGNGASFNEDLTLIQEKCEMLFEIHYRLSQELMRASTEVGIAAFARIPEQLANSLTTLVESSLLVEKQPQQVLKTQTKFPASVCFLLGKKLLDGQEKMPIVKASIITEKQAREMVTTHSPEAWTECAGEIVSNTATLEKHPNSNIYAANFKSMSVKKIKRCERKGSESVTEEKCAILFTVKIASNAINRTFQLEILSLPLVVIVHGNQDNNAKATILWDNAFAEGERLPFVVAERVPWPKMCETLTLRFVSRVGTSQGLLPEHFIFLAQKVFNDNSLNSKDFQERSVSWSQFNKEMVPGRGFTFWQWFDGVVELSKKHLAQYWSDKLIIGFISKPYVQELLSMQPDGTFLLRFSDSEIGGITIAHIQRSHEALPQIQNIQPFSAHDLEIRSLGDRIHDLTQLKYLYKQRPKDEAFQKHYTKEQDTPTSDGYKKAKIIMALSNDQTQQQPLSPSVPPTQGMGSPHHGSPLMHSLGYPSPPHCYSNPGIMMYPQMPPQGHMQLPFPHAYPEIQMAGSPVASPAPLSGPCNQDLSGSSSPACSPRGGISLTTASPFHQQPYQELMQVDPLPQCQSNMVPPQTVYSGSPGTEFIDDRFATLEELINDIFEMEAFPQEVMPGYHTQNLPANDCTQEWVG